MVVKRPPPKPGVICGEYVPASVRLVPKATTCRLTPDGGGALVLLLLLLPPPHAARSAKAALATAIWVARTSVRCLGPCCFIFTSSPLLWRVLPSPAASF
ncbi:hypothetical protein PSAC2689_30499 [Paraburkholderia sacchari]